MAVNRLEAVCSTLDQTNDPKQLLEPTGPAEFIGNVASLGLSTISSTPPSQKKDKQAHGSENSGPIRFRCNKCGFGTSNKQALDQHTKLHGASNVFRCSVCDYSVNMHSHLKRHEKRDHHPGGRTPSEYNAAIPATDKPAKSSKTLRCLHCSFGTFSFVALAKHLVSTNHEEKVAKSITEDPNTKMTRRKVYYCTSCPYWDASVTILHQHVIIEHGIGKPVFRCSACDYTNFIRRAVNRHVHKGRSKLPGHEKAITELLQPLPADRYAKQLKLALVPEGQNRGKFPAETAASTSVERNNPQLLEEEKRCRKERLLKLEEMVQTFRLMEEASKNGEVQRAAGLEERRCQLKQMEETVSLSQSEIERIAETKQELHNRRAELSSEKMKAELQFRTLQCEVLKLELSVQSAEGLERSSLETLLTQSKEKVSHSEVALKDLESGLDGVQREEEELDQLLKEANDTRLGAGQLLDIVRQEINSLEAGEESTELKELKSGAEELISSYITQEEKLCGLKYLNTLNEIQEKEASLLGQLHAFELDM